MIEPTERSMPPVAMTAVMPSAITPMNEKLRVMLKKLSEVAKDSGCSQLIKRQMMTRATVTQNDWSPTGAAKPNVLLDLEHRFDRDIGVLRRLGGVARHWNRLRPRGWRR